MKPKLLVVELWGVGDLSLAAPFLESASRNYAVTLLAKPAAQALVDRFYPAVRLIPSALPWTAFRAKYHLQAWPWRELRTLVRTLRAERFEVALSARWDPRDHVLLRLSGARRRLGFSRLGSRVLLTEGLPRPVPSAHRYEYWLAAAAALGIDWRGEGGGAAGVRSGRVMVVHTGASQPTKVWPLERYEKLVAQLRGRLGPVQVLCDPDQVVWWQGRGELEVEAPATLAALITRLESARWFIGNDSGPGHLAALSGVPTFTIFGNQFPERFAPRHPAAEWIEGRPCPYKPCYDRCRFAAPNCLHDLSEGEVWERVSRFLDRQLRLD